jgi:hypothetical protein
MSKLSILLLFVVDKGLEILENNSLRFAIMLDT